MSYFSTSRRISSYVFTRTREYSTTIYLQDLEAIIWLEGFLSAEPRTLVLISHDQDFLNNVVEETIILRNKTLKYFEGTPAAFDVNERKEAKRLTSAQEALDKKREHVRHCGRVGAGRFNCPPGRKVHPARHGEC
jgi:ABC-type sulfate/molybdate transport systems ATPase subunit